MKREPSTRRDDERVTSPALRAWLAFVLGLAGFVAWAIWTPLAEAVPASGTMMLEGNRKIIQHMYGGMVSQIHVHEGQEVTRDQVLIEIDPLTAQANQTAVAQEIDTITKNLLTLRRVLQGFQQIKQLRQQQIAHTQSELESVSKLVKRGFSPVNQRLQLENQILEFESDKSSAEIDIQQTEQSISNQENQLRSLQEKLKALQRDLALMLIRAPQAGQVVQLGVHTIGQVVQPAEILMELVPHGNALTADMRISPLHIDRVRVGQRVDMRFPNFANRPQLQLQAEITSISGDAVKDSDSGMSYYRGRAQLITTDVTPDVIAELKPGMAVEAMIQVGKRTLMSYLMHPLTRRVSRMMTEQ